MLIGLAAVIVLGILLWLVSLAVRDSSIVDIAWGPLLFLVGLTYYLATVAPGSRARLMLALVALWAIRLAAHIGARNLGHGEDFRYAAWRAQHPDTWWIRSYFKVFLLQGVVAWLVAMPRTTPSPRHRRFTSRCGIRLARSYSRQDSCLRRSVTSSCAASKPIRRTRAAS